MGLDPWGRRVGKAVAGTLVAFVLYAWWVFAIASGPQNGMEAAASSLVIMGVAHEVWAFSHGRPVYALRQRYAATPANTGWRTLGLAGDLILLGLFISLLIRNA